MLTSNKLFLNSFKKSIFILLIGTGAIANAQDTNTKHWQWQEPEYDNAIDASDVVEGVDTSSVDDFYDQFYSGFTTNLESEVKKQVFEVEFDPSINTVWGGAAVPQARVFGDWEVENTLNTSNKLKEQITKAKNEGKPYLLWVNIPSFILRVFDTSTGEMKMQSRVIVGASRAKTPIFNTDIVNIKFNPDWTPPPGLARQGRKYTPPGPRNPLGKARFSANNNRFIYLHDTDDHSLYNLNNRAISAGCIRVEEWNLLSQILLSADEQMVNHYTRDNKIRFVDIPHSLVWTSYERVDMNESGQLSLYPDVYGIQSVPSHVKLEPAY